MFKSLNQYFMKYRDIIITVVVVFIVDNLFFDGALRDKAKTFVKRAAGKLEKK